MLCWGGRGKFCVWGKAGLDKFKRFHNSEDSGLITSELLFLLVFGSKRCVLWNQILFCLLWSMPITETASFARVYSQSGQAWCESRPQICLPRVGFEGIYGIKKHGGVR